MTALQGDELPATVARYYEAIDGYDVDTVLDCVADDVLLALPPGPGQSERAARRLFEGKAGVKSWLGDRGKTGFLHEFLLCATSGSDCLLEARTVDAEGRPAKSAAISIQLDAAGRIARSLVLTTDTAVAPWDGDGGHSVTTDGRELMERYLHLLGIGEFEAAAACFSPDVVYSHGPYRNTNHTATGRQEFRGRDALLANFRTRGVQPQRHRVVAGAQAGRHYLFEGAVEGVEYGSASFVSALTIDDAGLAKRYIAWSCDPLVPRR